MSLQVMIGPTAGVETGMSIYYILYNGMPKWLINDVAPAVTSVLRFFLPYKVLFRKYLSWVSTKYFKSFTSATNFSGWVLVLNDENEQSTLTSEKLLEYYSSILQHCHLMQHPSWSISDPLYSTQIKVYATHLFRPFFFTFAFSYHHDRPLSRLCQAVSSPRGGLGAGVDTWPPQ